METRKRYSSSSDDRNSVKRTTVKRPSDPEQVKSKDKEKFKNSYIPVLKGEKVEGNIYKIQKKSLSYSKIYRKDPCHSERISELDEKLKLLEEKEKSVAEYYRKVQDLVNKYVANSDDENVEQNKSSRNICPQKKTSDAICNGNKVKNDFMSDFEMYVHQISEIWLATSCDFYSAMKNLKNSSPTRPMEFDIENVKIQLAVKQAKSLTLAKTRNVVEEVKKLLRHREIIREELEKLLNKNDLKLMCAKCESTTFVPDKSLEEYTEKLSKLGTGDSYKENSVNQETVSGSSTSEEPENKRTKGKADRRMTEFTKREPFSSEKEKSSGETEGTDSLNQTAEEDPVGSDKRSESLETELARKNETITNLNSKIFKLQKTFNEQSVKYNELQVKLTECHEKVQWNKVLWKQIGKLKEQIRGLQQSNKQLEGQKKDLEARLTRLDQEIDRLIKMNELLNKKKFLLSTQEEWYRSEDDSGRRSQERKPPDDKAVAEKQNAITQLKTILNIMTDQKNLAQQQICLYQSKIEELEKMLKKNNIL